MQTTDITAGELYTTGSMISSEPDALFILDTATSVCFATPVGAEQATLKKAEKGEAKRFIAILSTQSPTRIREHLDELRKLTVEDLLGEPQMSAKLPRGTFMRTVTPKALLALFAEVEEERAAIQAQAEAAEAARIAARNAEAVKARDLEGMLTRAGIPTFGPDRVSFDFEGNATLPTEMLKKLLVAAARGTE